VLDVSGVFGRFDRRDLPVKQDVEIRRLSVIQGDLFGFADEVAGRKVPVLTFSTIHRQFDGVSVTAFDGFIFVEHGLDRIRSRRYLR
jgi:hypothetical protein